MHREWVQSGGHIHTLCEVSVGEIFVRRLKGPHFGDQVAWQTRCRFRSVAGCVRVAMVPRKLCECGRIRAAVRVRDSCRASDELLR